MQNRAQEKTGRSFVSLPGYAVAMVAALMVLGMPGCSSAPTASVVEEGSVPPEGAVEEGPAPAAEEAAAPVVTPLAEQPAPAAQEIPAQAQPVPPSQSAAIVSPQPAPVPGGAQRLNYLGYTGVPWSKDFGVLGGRCDPVVAQAALGGAGGTRAVAVFEPGEKGGKFPGEPDDGDRACIGQALELARKGNSVAWSNAQSGYDYRLTMGRDAVDGGLPCREFAATASSKGAKSGNVKGVACRQEPAKWDFR